MTTAQAHRPSGMVVRWFPPAWLLLEADGKALYIDPAWIQHYYRGHPGRVIFSHYPEAMDGLPEPDLPVADGVLITHHHQDHVKTATLRRLLKPESVILATARCQKLIGSPYDVVRPGDVRQVADFEVTVVDAYNTPGSRSSRKHHHRGECVGYVVSFGGATVYHAGDTDLIPEMARLGRVDAAFLPIGGTFTMDIDEAVQAARLLGARIVVPIHHLRASPQAFAEAAAHLGVAGVVVPAIGERFTLPDTVALER